jgi:hypothetical protein
LGRLEAEFGPNAMRLFGTLLAYTDAEWDMDFTDVNSPPEPPIPNAARRKSRRTLAK